ncbi:MAG: GYDIA family GHMP kinase [Flavobacteriales bacterium]|nr:GYDIA family GHMP kinase [Flavobacteriales bacterium]
MQEFIFASHTKLLLTGEYLVTRGALALALPLKFKQTLKITDTGKNGTELLWQSREQGQVWFEATFDKDDFQINATTDKQIATTLQQILIAAREMNFDFLRNNHEIHAETETDFMMQWGLGSSSTLISSIARWANVNPYTLLKKTFGGSGYDIACATAQGPIFFQLINQQPEVKAAEFHPLYSHYIGFVYLGKKMNSRSSMNQFNQQANYTEQTIRRISDISIEITKATTIDVFENLLNDHESIMSDVLQIQPIKQQLFIDYPYTIKSLGAWGGDFILFTCRNPQEAISYFQQKAMQPVFWFPEIVQMNS